MKTRGLALFLFGYSSVVSAEVSDKIILPNMMVTYAVVLSTLAIALLRKWPLWFPLVSTITVALSSGGLATVLDTHIGPAAIAEQGVSYRYFAYSEIAVVLIANIIGIAWGMKLRGVKNA